MKCNLCNSNDKLEESHIIPKFIYRWLKKTSLTGGIRTVNNPNKREQDGLKTKFLCGICEDKFEKYETFFSKNIFFKATQNNLEKTVGNSEIYNFCVSIIWRSIKYLFVNNIGLEDFDTIEIERFNKFLADCENYFNNDTELSYKFHIIPITTAAEDRGLISKNSFWHQRGTATHIQVFSNEKEGFDYMLAYVQIPFFIFTVEILENDSFKWSGTEVNNNALLFDCDEIQFPNLINKLLESNSEVVNEAKKTMTDTQRAKLDERVKNELNKKTNPYL